MSSHLIVFKLSLLSQNKPDMTIDVDNCLMSCAFHPEHPVSAEGELWSVLGCF